MLNADSIRKQPDCLAASFEVPELSCAVKIGRVPDYVVVDMPSVSVGADYKSVVSFQKALGKLIAYFICLFGRNLSRLKGLTDLVGNNIVLLLSACDVIIVTFG